MGIKRILKDMFLKNGASMFDEHLHKICDDCCGAGIDPTAGLCMECDGDGFVEKTRSEIWEDKINN